MATRKSKKTQSQKQEQKVSQNVKIILGEIKAKRKKKKKQKKTPPQGRSEAIFIDNRQWQPRIIYGGYGPAGSNVETARTVQQTAYQQQALPIARETPRGIPQVNLQGNISTQTDILPPPPAPLAEFEPVGATKVPIERSSSAPAGQSSLSQQVTEPKPPARTSLASARGKKRGIGSLRSLLGNSDVINLVGQPYADTLDQIEKLPAKDRGDAIKETFNDVEEIISNFIGKDATELTVSQIIKEIKKNK